MFWESIEDSQEPRETEGKKEIERGRERERKRQSSSTCFVKRKIPVSFEEGDAKVGREGGLFFRPMRRDKRRLNYPRLVYHVVRAALSLSARGGPREFVAQK